MVYVPKCTTDVFVSYAHADDGAPQGSWIEALINELEREVRKRLGGALGNQAAVWRDTERIRVGDEWPESLREAIRGTATFLAVVSPNYMSSRVCSEERGTFLGTFDDRDSEAALRLLRQSKRFLKLLRLPLAEGFLPEIEHLVLYSESRGDIARELPAASDEFKQRVAECATALKDILQGLRRQRQKVYIAWSSKDQARWDSLQAELRSQGYDVQPEGPVDAFLSDEQVQGRMRDARAYIHVLGGGYDEAAARQLRLARELGLRMFLWISPEAESTTSVRQGSLRDSVINGVLDKDGEPDEKQPLPDGWALFRSTPLPRLIQAVGQFLVQPVPPSPRAASDRRSVYLLCDPTTGADVAFAQRLGDKIRDQEKLGVLLPSSSPDDRERQHRAAITQCDGMLVYGEAAPRQWLKLAVEDATYAEAAAQRGPLKSKALLTADPNPWRDYPIKLIQRGPGFDLTDLEPFLAPLRG
jgi:hypothetical protein